MVNRLSMTFTALSEGGEYEHQLTADENGKHKHAQTLGTDNAGVVAITMRMLLTSKSMVGMQTQPTVQLHIDKLFNTQVRAKHTTMYNLIKQCITGAGLASPTPIVNAH